MHRRTLLVGLALAAMPQLHAADTVANYDQAVGANTKASVVARASLDALQVTSVAVIDTSAALRAEVVELRAANAALKAQVAQLQQERDAAIEQVSTTRGSTLTEAIEAVATALSKL